MQLETISRVKLFETELIFKRWLFEEEYLALREPYLLLMMSE